MRVSIIGPGRLGRSLHLICDTVGHASFLVGRTTPEPDTDIRLITVRDDDIPQVLTRLAPDRPTFHCSGVLDDAILDGFQPAGRIHPLMTFPGPEIAMPSTDTIPAAISGDTEGFSIAWSFAESIGFVPFRIPPNTAAYHAAAVIAGNFATVLFERATQVLIATGMSQKEAKRILGPLAIQSVQNAIDSDKCVVTGPAARSDTATIENHCAVLSELGLNDTLDMYRAMSASTSQFIELKTKE